MNDLQKLIIQNPLIECMIQGEEVFWENKNRGSDSFPSSFSVNDILDAEYRLTRFAPFIYRTFSDTRALNGMIESPLKPIPIMKKALEELKNDEICGDLFLKCDNQLPVSGSIKARGGIYEVLKFAEEIAQKAGMISSDQDYSIFCEERFQEAFSRYKIAVGSTGNLGLSIGIISSALGFRSEVHMSSDAKTWKKDLLRSKGVQVIEYDGDYSLAVAAGREKAKLDPFCHFVDDENSVDLFLGYATAALRLQKQLIEQKITVDQQHPLFVYLPCGVGGGPGGITFGLKQIFGNLVHCYFAEPVQAPCVMLGLMTDRWNQISVLDIGLTGKTAADGLAVQRPSGLVCRLMAPILDGCFTVRDERLFQYLQLLYQMEQIFIEPSASAGFSGIFSTNNYLKAGTHIVWATGGNMVPLQEKDAYLRRSDTDI
ncbi:MAG: D-serine ammonia-lyase [Flexilinea flocculi]|nr:D-serine ammonia-lyase [Flexilinea flocculi]